MTHSAPPPASQRRWGSIALATSIGIVLVAGGGLVWSKMRSIDRASTVQLPSLSATPAPPSPTSSPKAEKPEEEPKGKLVIHGTGDVSLDPVYIPALRSNGYEWAWSGLHGLFEDDDLTIINLECPISNEGQIDPKEFNFRCDPKAIPAMRKAGIEVANLGNNHSMDFGKEGMLDSRKNLLDGKVAPVGAGKDSEQAAEAAYFQVKGWKIAVVGFGGVVPASDWIATRDSPGMANGDAIPFMVRAVEKAAKKADLVFVVIHWGTELMVQPDADDVPRAHAMIEAGADAIFGGHSHRLQPMDVYKGAPIFWSLGNFVWPIHSAAGANTAVAELIIKPNGSIKGRLLPATIVSDGHPSLDKGR